MPPALRIWFLAVFVALPLQAGAADGFNPISATDVEASALRWPARPVIVFADTPDDPSFAEQMRLLDARWPELAAREVVVVFDTDPARQSTLRQTLRPRGFTLVLLDRDGRVAQRKPYPLDARELGRALDRMR